MKSIPDFFYGVHMTIDSIIKYGRKEYKMTSRQSQGAGMMYFFREIMKRSEFEVIELSEECKIFQVYGSNGDMEIDAYNQSSHLVPRFRRFIKKLYF